MNANNKNNISINDLIGTLQNYNMRVVVKEDHEVYTKMCEKLDDYCNTIRSLDEEIFNKASVLKKEIIKCFEKYYNGDMNKATNIMNNLIRKYNNDLYIHDMKPGCINIYPEVNKYLYKGAIADWTSEITREYILHIPFNRRDLIKTQRFSIPGIPCLYLGHSLHGIWEELNRPAFNDLFVSRFELDENVKILDLGLSILEFIDLKDVDELKIEISKLIKPFLLTNILKIACLIKVENKNRSFKSEYIVPQLLLMSIVNSKIGVDGVRYFSTKINNDSYIYNNYAFPAIKSKSDNYISRDIVNKVKLSYPMNIGLYSFINDKSGKRNKSENLYRDWTTYGAVKNYSINYSDTVFYEIEQKIINDRNLVLEKIKL